MPVLKPGEELIAYETDIRSGAIGYNGVNDAYDLYLAKVRSGDYVLIVFMKLQFFFRDGPLLAPMKWTVYEKANFVTRWQQAIQSTWGGRTIKQLKNNKKVVVDFRFQTKIGGWMLDHWEIYVRKVDPKTTLQSNVEPVWGNVNLDSSDLTQAVRSSRQGGGRTYRQRGAVHEFGHMLGLDDEYPETSPHRNDEASIMNRGETIHPRHDAVYVGWLEEKLAEKKVA